MKLKTRLIISICIILFVPFILATCAVGIVHFVRTQNNENYTVEGSYSYLAGLVQNMDEKSDEVYKDLETWISEDQSRALDQTALKKMNQETRDKGFSYLLVRIDGKIFYNGSGSKDRTIKTGQLPPYGANSPTAKIIIYLSQQEPALLRQIDFSTEDGRQCSVFMVTTSRSILPGAKKAALDMIISIFLILILTAIILVGWTYQGIVPRLKTLVKAAGEIREGELDHPLDVSGSDEISELFRAFEDMRKRLQAVSIEKMHDDEEQRQLIANIAHDLKTPITAIKGYAEGLRDGVAKTPEKQALYLGTICNKANEMNALINELTLYSKIDMNKVPYNFQSLNVKNFFMDCAEEVGMDLESQKIEFTYYNYVNDNVNIIADPEQLERVIHNIIGNSVKYMGERPGIIELRVRDVGDYIQVEIEDNGRGISARDLPYIFDRTFRADASRNSNIGGSGIGLSIVKKIIEDHGGNIWATSKDGVGTVMYFVLRKDLTGAKEAKNEQDSDHRG